MSAREQPPRRPPRDLEVRVEGTRCPYCHDAVRDDELQGARVCERCLSRHHRECWDGRCASCQHTTPLEAVAPRPAAAQPRVPFAGVRYPPGMKVFNLGYVTLMMLSTTLLPLVALTGSLDPDDPGLGMVVWAALIGLTTAFSLGMWAVNTLDAFRSRAPIGARLMAALSPLNGGISGFVYFLVFARGRPQPPADAPPTPAPRPDPKADPKA